MIALSTIIQDPLTLKTMYFIQHLRKLSSHRRNLILKKALWEYNKIFRTTHILNLINDEELRKNIKKARNRTEAYQQLQRTIRKVHSGVLSGGRAMEN